MGIREQYGRSKVSCLCQRKPIHEGGGFTASNPIELTEKDQDLDERLISSLMISLFRSSLMKMVPSPAKVNHSYMEDRLWVSDSTVIQRVREINSVSIIGLLLVLPLFGH